MNHRKFVGAVLIALAMCGLVGFVQADEPDPGTKCQCYFPNSNSYGLYDVNRNCAKLDCWVPISD